MRKKTKNEYVDAKRTTKNETRRKIYTNKITGKILV